MVTGPKCPPEEGVTTLPGALRFDSGERAFLYTHSLVVAESNRLFFRLFQVHMNGLWLGSCLCGLLVLESIDHARGYRGVRNTVRYIGLVPTIGFRVRQLSEIPIKGACLELNLQYEVHLINRKAFGFWHEEICPDRSNKHPRRKEEPCSVPKGVKDVRERFGDWKLNGPIEMSEHKYAAGNLETVQVDIPLY